MEMKEVNLLVTEFQSIQKDFLIHKERIEYSINDAMNQVKAMVSNVAQSYSDRLSEMEKRIVIIEQKLINRVFIFMIIIGFSIISSVSLTISLTTISEKQKTLNSINELVQELRTISLQSEEE